MTQFIISKHVPADGVVRAQKKWERPKCFTYWGGARKNVRGNVKVFKKMNNYKNAWLPLH